MRREPLLNVYGYIMNLYGYIIKCADFKSTLGEPRQLSRYVVNI